jgi:hypothetical protein
MIKRPKLMIVGHGRHGKDTFADGFRECGWSCKDSSYASAEIFLFDELKDAMGYQTVEECWNDRHNHRALWFRMIAEYNSVDNCRLMRGIYEHNDIYVGIRSRQELLAGTDQRLIDLIIWVERPGCVPESGESMNIRRADSDIVVYNDGSPESLRKKGRVLAELLDGEGR